jgi:hypothetical protein
LICQSLYKGATARRSINVTGQDDVWAGNLREERFDKPPVVNNKWSMTDEKRRSRIRASFVITINHSRDVQVFDVSE